MATIFRPPLFHRRWEIDPTQTGISAQFGVQFNINLFPPPPPQIPPGEGHYNRPDPIYWSNTWTQSLVLTTLRSQDKMTVGKQHTERPPPVDWRAGQTLSLVLSTLRSQDAMNPGEQRFELPPIGHIYPQQLRTWLHSYNLNLIGKDRMTVGKQLTDLPPRDHQRTEQLRTWTFTFNPNLVGQDFFPPGRVQHTTRPDPVQWYQNWTLNLLQSTLTPAEARPFGPFDWPLPEIADQPQRSYQFTFNLNLIAQDFFPPGERVTDLPPRDYDRTNQLRTWLHSYNLNLIGKDFMTAGDQLYDLPPRGHERQDQQRTWLWNYNLNLIGQDFFPPGERLFDRPPGPDWRNSWTLSLQQTTLIPSFETPFGPYQWPIPQPVEQPQRSYSYSFNLNLIAQDFFPPGQHYTDRPPGPDWRQGWLHNFNLNLIGQDFLPPGERIVDLPPRDYSRTNQLRTWLHNYNLNLIGKDVITRGKQLYDLPPLGHHRQDQQRTWLYWFNLNLVGQDAMVVGKQYTERPPGPDWRNGWVQNLLQNTLAPTVQNPFGPYDWPNPKDYQQPNKSFHHSFNLNLIDTNLLLLRQMDWPNPKEAAYPTSTRSWLSTTNELLARLRPPFTQQDWPLPKRQPEPSRNYTHSSLYLQLLHRPPFIQSDWPLPGVARQPDRSFQFVPTNLLALPIVFPVGKQITDLPPTGYYYPASLRFASNSPAVPPPTPPAGGNFEWIIRARRRHRR